MTSVHPNDTLPFRYRGGPISERKPFNTVEAMHSSGREKEQLRAALEAVSSTCNNCGLCVKQCEFLTRFGTPKRIADGFETENKKAFDVAFACSLCGFCSAVCPQKVDPDGLFLAMRRAAVAGGNGGYPAHRRLIRYEARGCSPRYSWYGFPEGCDTVFFPGCTLPGTRPGQTLALFRYLQQEISSLGIALDCCIKPSHDLGRTSFFDVSFGALRKHFLASGIGKVITACPSCHKVFKAHGAPLQVESAYEILAASKRLRPPGFSKEMAVHDPCAVRLESGQHRAVRLLAALTGGKLSEMPRSGPLTLCCGEGGAVGHLFPDLSRAWSRARRTQAAARHLVTYCSGCSGLLSAVTPTSHILDILFGAGAGQPFGMKVSKAPLTYLNRIRLKHYLKRRLPAVISGTRPYPELRRVSGRFAATKSAADLGENASNPASAGNDPASEDADVEV